MKIVLCLRSSVKIVLCLRSVNQLFVYDLASVFAWYRGIMNCMIHPEVTRCAWWDVNNPRTIFLVI